MWTWIMEHFTLSMMSVVALLAASAFSFASSYLLGSVLLTSVLHHYRAGSRTWKECKKDSTSTEADKRYFEKLLGVPLNWH